MRCSGRLLCLRIGSRFSWLLILLAVSLHFTSICRRLSRSRFGLLSGSWLFGWLGCGLLLLFKLLRLCSLLSFRRSCRLRWSDIGTLGLGWLNLGALRCSILLLLLLHLLFLSLLLLSENALSLNVLKIFNLLLDLLLLYGEFHELVIGFFHVSLALKDLITDIAGLHELIILDTLLVLAKSGTGPVIELLVHLFLKQDRNLLLSKDVDISEEHDVLRLDALVVLCVAFLVLFEGSTEVFDVFFH